MIQRSPRHAWAQHPKLNPQYVTPAGEAKFDLGTAAHALFLEGRNAVWVVEADDWRTNAAKEQRDLARAHGRIPLLDKDWNAVQSMCGALRDQLPDGCFQGGEPEQTIVWRDRGVLCRARVDYLRGDTIDDYKSTSASAAPGAWSRTMFNYGYDIQAALYMRGTGATRFCFSVQETFEPYAVQTFELAPDALALANRKIDWALDTWTTCRDLDYWPCYPQRTAYVTVPPWVEQQWFDREARDEL
jgi:hypothetical protein